MKCSISRLKLFKACRRAYYLKYIEGLEPVQKSEALEIGTNYHELIEGLYNIGSLPPAEDDWSKELAMAKAYEKYIYSQFKVKSVEEWAEGIVGKHILIGRVDGIAEDGSLVEHKTTSLNLDEYEFNLQWDEQMLAYMWLTDTTHIWYTMIRKPTIRQKKDESEEEFFQRMINWYNEDTDSKIRVVKLERTRDQIADCIKELWWIMDDIESLDTQDISRWSKNTCYCNHWGRRCEYANICLNYDPNQEYVEFVRGEENEQSMYTFN